MIVLALVWLYFTTPTYQACEGYCGPCVNPSTPDEVALVNVQGDTLARHPASQPGAPDWLSFDWDGTATTVYAISREDGVWSCLGNAVTLSPVSVPQIKGKKTRIEQFDLVGRKAKLGAAGIYFERTTVDGITTTSKLVVVR